MPAAGIPPAPDRWVTDRAGFLSSGAVSALDAELEAFEQKTGHQIIVYIDRTTGGLPIEDWAVRTFAAWKVGRKGLDDGLALFIMADDRRVRIEVGYGLEALVPDITAGRIINDVLIPAVRNGDNDGGVRDAMRTAMKVISGQASGISSSEPGRPSARKRKSYSTGEMILAAIAILFFLILFITNPSLALWLLFSLLSGGRGGGGGGGGSFSGGGGRSGGGGASGSW